MMNRMKKKTTVIIVNYNGGPFLMDVVKGLEKQIYRDFDVFVVDNASVDGSIDKIDGCLLDMTVYRSSHNIGFAAANNYAVSKCRSRYIVLLNPDAIPDPHWLEELVKWADNNPDIAALGSRQMVYGRDNLLDGTGDVFHFSGKVWRRNFGSQLTEQDLMPSEIFSTCSAAALYRREAFLSVGGFDSDFFCYLEDVDLGFRLRLAGYRIYYVPSAIVHHVGSALTGGHRSDFSVYYGHRNIEWLFLKNLPAFLFLFFLPSHIILSFFSIMYFCLIGRSTIIFRAKKDALTGIGYFWKKRKSIQKNRSISTLEILKLIDKRMWFF